MVARSAAFVNEVGKVPAAPSHGLCGSAGGRPSQSPSGDSSPEGGAKLVHNQKFAESLVSPPPLGGAGAQWAPALDRAGRRECHAFGMTERARCQRPLRMGCVEALASCPLSRLAATALPKGEPSLASPFGGGALQRRAERAKCHRPGKTLRCFPSFLTRAARL